MATVGTCTNPSTNAHMAGEFPDHCDYCFEQRKTIKECASRPCDDPKRCATLGACTKTPVETVATPQADGAVGDYSGKVDGKGSKVALDGSKLRVELVPPQIIEGIADILTFGAKKYAAHNWMRGISWMAIIAGVLRHIYLFARGVEIDSESGKPHLYHAMCGLTFLAWYAHGPNAEQYRTFDDRVFNQ